MPRTVAVLRAAALPAAGSSSEDATAAALIRAVAVARAVATAALLTLLVARLPPQIPDLALHKLPVHPAVPATPSAARTRLVVIPHAPSPMQRRLLVALRRDCGWGEDQIDDWLRDAACGRRLNFFIVRDALAAVPPGGDSSVCNTSVIGMVALILDHPAGDVLLASREHAAAMVCSLCVFKQWHNNGHGTLAMSLIEQVAKLHGARTVTLETMGDRLIRLYYRLGYREFRPRGERAWGTDVASFCKDL
ncbi:hypothetical protein HDU84_003773 [Entophlyctis sp. JEL0112]|nr:hypothetical protein HDU84_003773 [Entophlyctis sp. JEL0112]